MPYMMLLLAAVLIIALAVDSVPASANANESYQDVLLPKPRIAKWQDGTLPVGKNVTITYSHVAAKISSKVAEMLAGELKEQGVKAEVVPADSAVSGLVIRLEGGRRRGLGAEKYCLKIGPGGVLIGGGGGAGLFYGTRTLLQLLQAGTNALPYCQIEDWPDYRYRMVHYDIAREQMSSLPYLKKVIDRLSYHKINMVKMYFETRFKFEKHPLLSPPGVWTAEQARELDEYARERYVELVPEVNTLGHMENALSVKEYKHLAEDQNAPYELCSTSHEGKKLVNDLIAEISAPFKTKFIHVGGDETGQTGTCPNCAEQVKRKGKGGLYIDHFLAVHKMVKARGLRMMMWGDMLLAHKELVGQLPKDIIIFDWHYENSTLDTVQFFRRHGFDVFVCPAMSGFSRICAPYLHATDNIYTFIGQGKEGDAMGECTCAWELRLGHLFENDYFGMILSADRAWNTSITLEDFNKRFCKSFYGLDDQRPLELYHAVSDGFYEPMKDGFGQWWNWHHITYGGGLEDVTREFGDKVTEKTLKDTEKQEKKALALWKLLKRDVKRNGDALDFLDMPAIAHANAARQVFYYKQAVGLIEEARKNAQGRETKLARAEELLDQLDQGLMYFEQRFEEALARFGSSEEDLKRVASKRATLRERKQEIVELRG